MTRNKEQISAPPPSSLDGQARANLSDHLTTTISSKAELARFSLFLSLTRGRLPELDAAAVFVILQLRR
jgi:hypothetical protein